MTLNAEPAEPREIHVALLAGLLSHVGLRDPRGREYQGARGARFAIFPGSALGRRLPDWVMAAELMETSRLWGLNVARIEPEWVEPLAGHLVKRSYSEPRWQASRGSVVATERVTLYGLPIVAGRTVAYGRIDPALSRELFIRRALVEGDWRTRHAFFEENRRRLEEVEALEDRARRRDLYVGDQALFEWLDERVPPEVVSGGHFDRWWRDARREDPDRLTFPRELLVPPDVDVDPRRRPEAWKQGELVLPLSYRFEPGAADDGVTVHVPLKVLPQLRPDGFDWLVPAFREELVVALLRSLPKDVQAAARAGAGGRRRGGRGDDPAQRPPGRGAGGDARAAARRARPGVGVRHGAAAAASADDVPRRGRGRPRRGLRQGARRAAGGGEAAAALRAGGGDRQARAQRAHRLDARDAAADRGAARYRAGGAGVPGARRRGRLGGGPGARVTRGAGGRHAGRHAPARCCSRRRHPAATSSAGSPTRRA